MKIADSALWTSSGSTGLDGLLGGGYRAGRLVEYFGKSNTGKTQIAMQAAMMAAAAGGRVLFLDSEGSFRPERIQSIAAARGNDGAGSLQNIVYLRVSSAAEQREAVRTIQTRKETAGSAMVVVDSLTRNFSVDLPGASNLLRRQEALGVHLSEMARDAQLNGRAYVLTNRVTFGAGDQEVGIGGATVTQLVHESVRLQRVGQELEASCLSNGTKATLKLGSAGVD